MKRAICLFGGLAVFLSVSVQLGAKMIAINDIAEQNITDRKNDDVKFILESSLGTSSWEPGVTKVESIGKNLLDYDTSGLKYYSVKGKVNIFDTDVLEVEKYGTFSSGDEQKKLLKLRSYNKDSALEGMNISVRAFALLKYFYFYENTLLDGLAYEYDYYNFYARATNNVDAIYWWGKTNRGDEGKEYVKLPKGSKIELTTEFHEHRLYLVDLKAYVKRFFLDSLQIGYFSTYWARESFAGVVTKNEQKPVIQTVLLESEGVSLLFKHRIKPLHLDLKLRYSYGLDNYIVVTQGHFDADYQAIDGLLDYRYDIYETNRYTVFTKLNLMYSAKWFDNAKYTLDTESVLTAGISVGVLF